MEHENETISTDPYYTAWLHGTGVLLSFGALIVGGFDNPDIGFPIAVGIVAALGVSSSSKPDSSTILRVIRGSVTAGGIRQGVFIKAMFAVALLYSGSYVWLSGATGDAIPSLLLGMALGLSSIASEMEARSIDSVLDDGPN